MDRHGPVPACFRFYTTFEVPFFQIHLKISLHIGADTKSGIAHDQDHLHNRVFAPAPQDLQLLTRERLIMNLRFCLRHDNIPAEIFPAQFTRNSISIQILNQADHVPHRGSAVLFPELIDPILSFLNRHIIHQPTVVWA